MTTTPPLLFVVPSEDDSVGQDRIRHFVYINARWRWRPTKTMRSYGFQLVNMGRGGPGLDAKGRPAPSVEDQQRAIELNRAWDHVRAGHIMPPAKTTLQVYAEGSIGFAYQKAMEHRKAERLAKGTVWTSRQEKRDSWSRSWRWLSALAECDPRTVKAEHFVRIDPTSGKAIGLIPKIEAEVSVTERHMVIKTWRALWVRMSAMTVDDRQYCRRDADPSKQFSNTPPKPRDQVWYRREVYKLVQVAWRNGYYGLAALIAVAWDSQFSPVDNRSLTLAQSCNDDTGIYFVTDRAKTGRAAVATLSPWSEAILLAYLRGFGADLLDNVPLFWTRGGRPVSRLGATGRWGGDHGGGRHVAARPYSESALQQDFRELRELAFGKDEKRQLQDMRRSGAVEGDAGGASVEDQSNKMANTIASNNRLRRTYNPVNVPSARRYDGARIKGAAELERRATKSVTATPLVTLIAERRSAKPLK
ncbi:hypothetical protein AAFG13_06145 [Bradyrhizobium sp. B124]|uniref:hypothetical protein n=1 Tax=Bradyrhizobium sp. B124 TaxID=3140245 RepID=UPI003182C8C0